MVFCTGLLKISIFFPVFGASAVRLHPPGGGRIGIQTRGRHHRHRPHGSALVARRDRAPQGPLPGHLRHALPHINPHSQHHYNFYSTHIFKGIQFVHHFSGRLPKIAKSRY